ncbi:MAG: GGDEF domain-containing protein [Lachnospiraceae bacterium]|nr:GGDEF domain-containing protein [Lachnospiraceae bacterium]
MKGKFVWAAVSIIILAFFATVFSRLLVFEPEDEIRVMETGWTAEYRGTRYQGFIMSDISSILPGNMVRGDVLTLTHEIEGTASLSFPTLLIKTQYCAYDVMVDDKVIESFGLEDFGEGNFIGCGFHFVSLPRGMDEHTLTIRLYESENNAFSGIYPPRIGNYSDLEGELMHNSVLIINAAYFLICFGTIFFLIAFLFSSATRAVHAQMAGTILCIHIGLWILFYNNISYNVIRTNHTTFFEYILLLLLPASLFMMMSFLVRGKVVKILRRLVIADVLLSAVVVMLHVRNIVHIRAFRSINYVILSATIIYSIVLNYRLMFNKSVKRVSRSAKILAAGLEILSVSLLISVPLYLFKKYGSQPGGLTDSIVPIGTLAFAGAMLLNFLLFVTESYSRRDEYAFLERMAYSDGLTMLSNRAMADAMLEEIDKADYDYCLISMDINGLKKVNDELGHESGDHLLTRVSSVVAEAFGKKGVICRVGGDELLGIIEDSDRVDVDTIIQKMTIRVNALNSEEDPIRYSISYGVAYRHDCPGEDSHAVYMLADRRMYEFKRQYYRNLMRD